MSKEKKYLETASEVAGEKTVLQKIRESYSKLTSRSLPLIMATTVFLTGCGSKISNLTDILESGPRKPATTEGVPLDVKKSDVEKSKEINAPGGELGFLMADPKTGEIKFNWWALLVPAQIHYSYSNVETGVMAMDVNQEWSRLFNSAQNANPADKEKMMKYIEQEMQKQFVEVLYGLDNSKAVYHANHPEADLSNIKIKRIQIIGTASPEGPGRKGPETLLPGKIDQENIKLAKLRAEKAQLVLIDSLSELGLLPENFEHASEIVSAQEIQFSDAEITTLTAIAQNYPGNNPLEKVFSLIQAYNRGEIKNNFENETDPVLKKNFENTIITLNNIVGAKRSVKIGIEYEGKQKKTVIIPLPWLILIPFLIKFPPKKKDSHDSQKEEQKTGEPKPEPEDPYRRSAKDIENDLRQLPEKVKEIKLPEKGSDEYLHIKKKTLVDDLYQFYNNPKTKERGLDYDALTKEMAANYDLFKSDEDRENYLTVKILKAWREHDINSRKEAGIQGDALITGLDYENQENQIKFARMHALELIRLAREKKAGDPRDYFAILTEGPIVAGRGYSGGESLSAEEFAEQVRQNKIKKQGAKAVAGQGYSGGQKLTGKEMAQEMGASFSATKIENNLANLIRLASEDISDIEELKKKEAVKAQKELEERLADLNFVEGWQNLTRAIGEAGKLNLDFMKLVETLGQAREKAKTEKDIKELESIIADTQELLARRDELDVAKFISVVDRMTKKYDKYLAEKAN